MIEATLERVHKNDKQTIGVLTIPSLSFQCHTLERAWLENKRMVSCIPTGEYLVRWSFMNRTKTHRYEIEGVPDRSKIFFHGGNYFFDSHGCILLGKLGNDINADGEYDLIDSKKTLKKFESVLNKENFKLTIV